MGLLLFGGSDYLNKIQSVRPENLVALWPQNEPSGGISTEIVRGYDGAYTGVTLGHPGVPGSGLTSAGYDGLTSFNNIYTAGFANDNLLSNPGFETAGGGDPDFWANWVEAVGSGTFANEVVIVHEGVDAMKFTGGVAAIITLYQDITVVAGLRYRLRFWTRGDGATDCNYGIRDMDAVEWVYGPAPTGVTAAAYEMIAREFTAPAGCTNIRIYFQNPWNGGTAYVDACEVRRMNGFLGDQGTVIVPAQVANVGVWTDATIRYLAYISANVNNRALIFRSNVANTIGFTYVAGGVTVTQATAGLANLDFAIYGMTWDISAGATGEVMYYIDGVASGATDVGLGTWLGDLLNTQTVIGASSTAPVSVWHGDIGPVPVWSAALTPDEMRYLGT